MYSLSLAVCIAISAGGYEAGALVGAKADASASAAAASIVDAGALSNDHMFLFSAPQEHRLAQLDGGGLRSAAPGKSPGLEPSPCSTFRFSLVAVPETC